MSAAAAVTPIEWLHSLGAFLNDFYEAQCKAVKAKVAAQKKTKITNNSKLQSSAVKAPQSTQKHLEKRRSSLVISTPLKEKDNSPINATLTTPKPHLSISSTPFTEGRSRRTAAAKADKYIDIVSRRLAEVPANGSTPKSMKIASKLISEATPNSRRTILLSQTLYKAADPSVNQKFEESRRTPSKPVVEIPSETPASVRKRKRTAKIHQMFEKPLMTLVSAESNNVGSLSPAAIGMAPSTISKTRLNQTFSIAPETKKPAITSPVKNLSPVKTSQRSSKGSKRESPVKVQKVSPLKAAQKPSPLKEPKPASIKSQRVSPIKKSPQVSAPPVAATPKAPVVEFVAPQSVLRSSKRPRKPVDTSIFNEDVSAVSSPAMKKQNKFSEAPIFPTVSINSQSHVKIVPQTPQTVPVAPPVMPVSSKVSNFPTIIVPLTAAKTEETSSNEDLVTLATSSKRTPLRVQPTRTPTRTKSAIPSLSDYSAAAKIAVIEVAKNINTAAAAPSVQNSVSVTPKVEPWTSKFIQKEPTIVAPSVNLSKSSLNVNIKPVDQSKISGLSNLTSGTTASVPVVPRFPLNLANISNITKSTTTLLKSESPHLEKPAAIVPESPLSRAKRIDLENSSREEMMKSKTIAAEIKTEIPPIKVSDAKSTDSVFKVAKDSVLKTSTDITVNTSVQQQQTSKLPVKPKSAATVLPSPKIPSRLAEAFSGIDSELPPIDIGLVDDEKILKNVLNGSSANATESAGFVNPKMKKQGPGVSVTNNTNNNSINSSNNNNNNVSNNAEIQVNSQLHRTAVLNSAARKVNSNNNININSDNNKSLNPKQQTAVQPSQTNAALPSTPKPQPQSVAPSTKLDTSSPSLPEILSDDELDKRERVPGGKENRPTWAMTPNLTVALNAQRSQRAEDVFGKVQPIKLEDFFKGSGKKFPNRSSTTNWNNNI